MYFYKFWPYVGLVFKSGFYSRAVSNQERVMMAHICYYNLNFPLTFLIKLARVPPWRLRKSQKWLAKWLWASVSASHKCVRILLPSGLFSRYFLHSSRVTSFLIATRFFSILIAKKFRTHRIQDFFGFFYVGSFSQLITFEREICRSPNSLHMGFTFLMDANTSKYFYNYFMGMKQTLISHWKIKKISGIERLVLPFPDT